MGKTSSRTLAAAIAAGALIAIPATASAAQAPSPAAVKAFTARADAALDRAVTMFDDDRDRAAMRQFRLSRAFLGKAKMISTRLSMAAETDAQRTRAANAWRMVALERDENLEQLLALLDKVDAHVDAIVANALLADTKHRDAAIGVIQDLIDAGVTDKAEAGLNRIIAALTSGRAAEIGAQVNLLAGVKLPGDAQMSVARAIQANLGAQARVAAVLDTLIPQLPEESRAQLEKALDLVNDQLAAAAAMMEDVADLLPPFIRPMVQGILDDVKKMIAAITAPWVEAPGTETPTVPKSPKTPGVGVPQVPVPFPIPMPSFVLDIINQFLPGGLPVPTSGFEIPFMQDFFDSFFGQNGFMGGLFGGGTGGTTGGGLFGGLFGNAG